jgi:SSS family solute:Na+ symporter
MFIPFIIIVPGIMAAVLVTPLADMKAKGADTGTQGITYNDSLLLLMKQLLPNGLLGVAIAGMLAAFMAGMAANISAFNTVMSYDIWQTYVQKHKPDHFYTTFGRWATVAATALAIGTSYFASHFPNMMTYLQTLFGFFNAPLFATFILGMFWKRMSATAGWVGLVSGTAAAVLVAFLSEDAFGSASTGVLNLSGQGASFVAAGAAFVVDIAVSYVVTMMTQPRAESELRGLVYSLTPKEDLLDEHAGHWYTSPTKLAGVSLVMVIVLNLLFR